MEVTLESTLEVSLTSWPAVINDNILVTCVTETIVHHGIRYSLYQTLSEI